MKKVKIAVLCLIFLSSLLFAGVYCYSRPALPANGAETGKGLFSSVQLFRMALVAF